MGLIEDLLLAIRIAAFAALVPLIARLPIRKLEARLEPSHPPPFDEPRALRILRIGEAVLRLSRRFTSRPCLIRGVTLFYFLRRAGMDVSLVFGIGIGKLKGQDTGHCWLAREGKPFLEVQDPLACFLPMYAFNSGDAKVETGSALPVVWGRP